MASEVPVEKTGFLSGTESRFVLTEDDGTPWLLDGRLRLRRYAGGFVTVTGYPYSECRFEVIAIADAP